MSDSNLEIMCRHCGQIIQHVCNTSLLEEAKHLYRLRPDDPPPKEIFNVNNPEYSPGDEHAPIFTEAFLYTLLGKETARSVLYTIEGILRAAGLDPHQIVEQACKEEIEGHASRNKKKLANLLRAEKERSGVVVRVRLPKTIVAALDVAVADTTATRDWSSRSAVVESLIGERFLNK